MGKRGTAIDETLHSDLLFRFAPISTLVSLGIAILFALAMLPAVPQDTLRDWIVILALLSLGRFSLVVYYRRSPPAPGELKRWSAAYSATTTASALIWAAIPILFFPEDQPFYVMLMVVTMQGVVAASIVSMAIMTTNQRGYVVLMLTPLLFRLVWTGNPIYILTAVIVGAFSGMLISLAQWIFNRLRDARQVKNEERYRNDVMERLAHGVPLPQILQAIVLGVEEQKKDCLCSILLLDPMRKHVIHGAAPKLPAFFIDAIDGQPIGPSAGSCGTAMHSGKRVIVEDIRVHPYWDNYREVALRAGLLSCWSQPIKSVEGQVLGAFAIYQRVPGRPTTEDLRRIEIAAHLAGIAIERKSLQEDHELAALVYKNSSEAMVVSDAHNHVVAINSAFTQITGYRAEDVVGKGLVFSARNASDRKAYQEMMESVLASGKWQGELWNYRKNGERFACRVTVNSIRDAQSAVNRRVILLSDITEQKRADDLIWKQANYDPLIGLPNRRLFRDRLEQEIRKAHRTGMRTALLFLDLDRFKEVNDSLGHEAGDKLLVEAANRIASCVRESDTVARLGGDEFTIILSEIEDNAIIERVARNIIERMVQPFKIGDELAYVSVSIGITVYPDDSIGVDELIRNADMSMYAAKNAGRNRFSYFTSATQQDAQKRVQIINDLHQALVARQLCLHYQPIVDLTTRRIRKAEALLRWQHPHFGMIYPGEFIARAEEIGLIDEIGHWVFQEAARAAKRFEEIAAAHFQVSINVSPMQFRVPNRCATWLAFLEELGLPPDRLNLDVSESLLMEADGYAAQLLDSLREAGMGISLDDFGSGHSPLGCLAKARIDALKIDGAFADELVSGATGSTLVEAIVTMGRKLDLKVVAEGIETSAQGEAFHRAGCDYAQGYWFAKPMPIDEFESYLRRDAADS